MHEGRFAPAVRASARRDAVSHLTNSSLFKLCYAICPCYPFLFSFSLCPSCSLISTEKFFKVPKFLLHYAIVGTFTCAELR